MQHKAADSPQALWGGLGQLLSSKSASFSYTDCVREIAQHVMQRGNERMDRKGLEVDDWDKVFQELQWDCEEFTIIAGYGSSQAKIVVCTQEQVKTSMNELFPLLEQYEKAVLEIFEPAKKVQKAYVQKKRDLLKQYNEEVARITNGYHEKILFVKADEQEEASKKALEAAMNRELQETENDRDEALKRLDQRKEKELQECKALMKGQTNLLDPFAIWNYVKKSLDVTEHTFTHPELITEIALFLNTLEGYVGDFIDQKKDVKTLLALITRDREEFFGRLALTVPVIEKIMQLLVRNTLVPFACHSFFPNGEVPEQLEELVTAIEESPLVRALPVRKIFSFMQRLRFDTILQAMQSNGFQRICQNLIKSESDMNGLGQIFPYLPFLTELSATGEYAFALPLITNFLQSVALTPQSTEQLSITTSDTPLMLGTSSTATPVQGTAVQNTVTKQVSKPVTKTVAKPFSFPVNDGYFKALAFRDLVLDAQEGKLERIKEFITRYPEAKEYKDDKQQNLLSHALLGYCKGVDNAWHVVGYLLQEELMVSQEILLFLGTKEANETPERTQRKKCLLDELKEFSSFKPTLEQQYYQFPSNAPVVSKNSTTTNNENCCIS